ncbi:MAG: hypothetical protein ACKOQZ_01105, partial [Actinomycetota bacterium]
TRELREEHRGFVDGGEALVSLGGAPFAESLTTRGMTLADALRMSLSLTMPGEPVDTNGTTTARTEDDLTTTINVAENGSGSITVVATADAAALRLAPELPDALNIDDLQAAGWEVTVQNPTAEGGLSVTARREFATVDEATMFLSQLSGENGPLREMSIVRTGGVNDSTYTFSAKGGLRDGLAGSAERHER